MRYGVDEKRMRGEMCVCVHANKSVKKKYVGAIYEHVCVRALQNKGAI